MRRLNPSADEGKLHNVVLCVTDCVGLLAAAVEAVNIGVMMRTPHALSNNFFIVCLKFANFFNGISYVVLGAERYWLISLNSFSGPTTYRDCFFGVRNVEMFLSAGQHGLKDSAAILYTPLPPMLIFHANPRIYRSLWPGRPCPPPP